jgi:hypothetical protein
MPKPSLNATTFLNVLRRPLEKEQLHPCVFPRPRRNQNIFVSMMFDDEHYRDFKSAIVVGPERICMPPHLHHDQNERL